MHLIERALLPCRAALAASRAFRSHWRARAASAWPPRRPISLWRARSTERRAAPVAGNVRCISHGRSRAAPALLWKRRLPSRRRRRSANRNFAAGSSAVRRSGRATLARPARIWATNDPASIGPDGGHSSASLTSASRRRTPRRPGPAPRAFTAAPPNLSFGRIWRPP